MQRGTRSALSRNVPVQRGARSAFSRSVPMQRGARFVFRKMHAIDSRRGSKGLMGQRSHAAWRSFFETKTFPCSVALKVLGVTLAPVLSRVMFSTVWGFVVFVVLHVWRSRVLFSDSPWPSDPLLQTSFFHLGAPALYFPGCGAFLFSVFGVAFGCIWLPFGSLGPVGPG